MIMEKYVKLGERGQVVIPKEIRDAMHLRKTQRIKMINIGSEIVMRPLKEEKEPEDTVLEILKKVKLTEKDWKEIQRERDER